MVTEGRRYRVLEVVGKGGFGTVYKAELMGEGGFSKLVALKVLNADMEEVNEVAVRLRDEARVLGLLRHRAIVQVDGLVKLNDRWTVVMEYVEGADLKQVIAMGPVPVSAALTVIEETAGALHAAYTRVGPGGQPLKLLHRDIKPSNIQVTAAGETKLLDFGVARAEFGGREAETRSLMFGSIGYMSPERLDAVDGPGGDVYALGCVLVELLARRPVGKTSSKEKRHQDLLDGVLGDLKSAGVGADVISFAAELMAYEPDHRPSARDVERRAGQLRSRYAQPTLRDWAEDLIPRIAGQRLAIQDDLSGSILIEHASRSDAAQPGPGEAEPSQQTWSFASPEHAARPALATTFTPLGKRDAAALPPSADSMSTPIRPSRAWTGAIGLTVVGLVAIVTIAVTVTGTGLWAFWAEHREGTTAASEPVAAPASSQPTPEEPTELARPTLAVPPVAVPEPIAPPSEAASATRPAIASSPRSTSPAARAPSSVPAITPAAAPPIEPAPSATTTASADAHFSAAGDARSVILEGGGTAFPPGSLPAGAYAIKASFGDGSLVPAGSVQLIPGQRVTVNCSSTFTKCTAK